MDTQPERLNILRTLKFGSFHIGSSFADILTSGVWNRILITDLQIAAAPVALLSALRYLLAPLSIWAGNRSDTHPILGLRRLPYIWIGRLLMLISMPLLPVTAALLGADPSSAAGWLLATLAFLVYGIGTLISGSVFLALLRDRTPPSRRGQAMSIVQTFLVVSFPIAAVIFARLMPVYNLATLWQIVWLSAGLSLAFWAISLLGEERRGPGCAAPDEEHVPFRHLLGEMWAERRTRIFFLFLALGAVSGFAQDAVLEPFGGDVFGLNVGATTRFNAYWGAGVVLSMIATIVVTRHRAAHEQVGTTIVGLILTALPLALLGVVSLTVWQALLVPALVIFGFGFGIYAVGGVALLMAMTTDQRAGAYLGLWSMAQLIFRGVGIALGGALRDLAYWVTGSFTIAYATVFLLEAAGLLVCVLLVIRVDVPGFVRSTRAVPAPSPLAALAD